MFNKTIIKTTNLETKLRILHLEDTPSDAELVERELKKGKIQFEKLVVVNKSAFEKALNEFAPDIVIADHTLPSFDSLEAIRIMKQKEMKIPFILVSATVSDEYAVEVMKAGADDYVLKDRLHRLPQAILNAMEKKSAELKLHESETFNKGVLSSLSSHIAVIDQSGTLIAVNKAWDDFGNENGITSLDHVSKGSNYFNVCKQAIENGDSDAKKALAGIQSVFKKETAQFDMEYPCHSPEQQRWFLLNVINFGSDAQKVVISHQDITVRKLAEQSLQMSQSNLTALIENTDAIIYSLDSNFRFIAFNKRLHAILKKNYNLDIKIGDGVISFLEKLEPEELIGYKEKYLQALKGETVKFEKEFRLGEINAYSSFSIYPIWEEKTIIGLSCFVYDITKQKQDQQEKEKLSADLIQRNLELAISNKELEDFAYVASHDLQEPLRMVTSFLGLIEKKYSPIIDDKGKQYIHFAIDGAKRMRHIILDLLEFSRIGRTQDVKNLIDLNDIVHEVTLLCQKQIKETKAIISFENLPSLMTYKTPLRQVFQNIISNALKYHNKKEPPLITISAQETETNWQFTVKDNGIGIDKEHFDKIFVIFQRLHNKAEYTGTGIGLAVCKKIIENFGGKIWLESEENKGSTFYFTVPKISSSAEAI